jgi:hypothetical protein
LVLSIFEKGDLPTSFCLKIRDLLLRFSCFRLGFILIVPSKKTKNSENGKNNIKQR